LLIQRHLLDGIRSGRVTRAFRRWRRPTVRTGGTLLTAAGELEIAAVTVIAPRDISAEDARLAGYGSREELLADLDRRPQGVLYRIDFGCLRPDPRIVLRQSPVGDADCGEQLERLRQLDARAGEPWTQRVLELLSMHPGVRAADLCREVGQEKLQFKANVRKLKALGLTESLEVGYRLSSRGAALLNLLRSQP
jgi:hypothetical protein